MNVRGKARAKKEQRERKRGRKKTEIENRFREIKVTLECWKRSAAWESCPC